LLACMTPMPLIDPRPDDPAVIAQFLACGVNRACLKRPPVIHGTPFDEVRTWCPKTRQWRVWPVQSRGNWSLVLNPISSGFIRLAS
jgi:hypothetical protein